MWQARRLGGNSRSEAMVQLMCDRQNEKLVIGLEWILRWRKGLRALCLSCGAQWAFRAREPSVAVRGMMYVRARVKMPSWT